MVYLGPVGSGSLAFEALERSVYPLKYATMAAHHFGPSAQLYLPVIKVVCHGAGFGTNVPFPVPAMRGDGCLFAGFGIWVLYSLVATVWRRWDSSRERRAGRSKSMDSVVYIYIVGFEIQKGLM